MVRLGVRRSTTKSANWMNNLMDAIRELSTHFGIPAEQFQQFVSVPLPAAATGAAVAQISAPVPGIHKSFLLIANGMTLLPDAEYGPVKFWGTADWLRDSRYADDIVKQSAAEGFIPIVGDIPHLTSIRFADDAIIATDWEIQGQSDAWCRQIATTFPEYVQTIIQIYRSSPQSDWAQCYARTGARYDLDRL